MNQDFFVHLDQDQFLIPGLAHRSSRRVRWQIGAAMRWVQKWIISKEDENAYDVLLDAMMALFGAAVATEVIQIVFSTL